MVLPLAFLLFTCCCALCFGDRVLSWPGYGPPPTQHYAGFVEVDAATSTNLYYYLVESESKPDVDPLIWWMNGGPGASSVAGLVLENGPLLFNDQGQFVKNPYAWNKQANVLYVEFGPGVGYSFCANSSKADVECPQDRSDCSPCSASDTLVAQQNVVFIEKFLTDVFPSMRGRPLFLAGESYAGVYIPTLAMGMLEHFSDTSIANLQGLWVTDPCTDNEAQFGWLDIGVRFCYQSGSISKDVYNVLTDPSTNCSLSITATGDQIRNAASSVCRRAWRLYDLATAGLGAAPHPRQVPGLPMYIDPLRAYGPAAPPGGASPEAYFARPDVKAALHATASPNKVYHLELGNNGYSNYKLEYDACNVAKETLGTSMLSAYRGLVSASAERKSAANFGHIMISSGDIDPVVALQGTEAAATSIGFPVAAGGERRPWFYNSSAADLSLLAQKPVQWGPSLRAHDAGMQVGGFVTDFHTGSSDFVLQFFTVRGSGHMVPANAPQRALHIVNSALLQKKQLSPLLPEDWDTSTDDAFYGWNSQSGGRFTSWVDSAMSTNYTAVPQNAPAEYVVAYV